MTDALKIALDRFDVPPVSAGLADRIAAAAATPTYAPFAAPRRDRRGMWRRGRQVVLGTCAVALLSAGAVASGLLGKVGIEVPVLTAMLAPKPKPVVKPARVMPKPAPMREAVAAPPPVAETVQPGSQVRPLLPAERMALRQERRERREAFAAEHPVAAAIIRERVRQQLQRRAAERRQALMGPGIDPSLPGARPLDMDDRAALARAARRDRLVAEKMIDRRIQAREAQLAEKAETASPVGPPAALPIPEAGNPQSGAMPTPFRQRLQQMTPEERAARRARIEAMTPEQRAARRELIQQRRAQRLERQRQQPAN